MIKRSLLPDGMTVTIDANAVKVAIYIRVSTDKQAERGESLETQRTQLTYYAINMLGAAEDNIVVFEDAGYSGKNTDRPMYQKMMSQIRAGAFTHLLVYKIDRISRNLLDFSMMYKELQALNVSFVSKTENFDTSTAMGEAMLKIILVFAELERNMTSERVRHTMIGMAQNGRWNGGRIPFGYNYRTEGENRDVQIFEINPEEAEIVHMIFDLYEQDRSLVWLAKTLNDRHLRSRYGNEWSPVSLRIILRSVFYVGDYRYNVLSEGDRQRPKPESEWVTVKDHHVAIISREQFDRVQNILDSNKRIRRDRAPIGKHIHVFGGLILCGNCGKPLISSKAARRIGAWPYSYYPCPTRRKSMNGCAGRSVSDPVVGEFTFNYILNMLNAQRDFADIHSPDDLQKHLLFGDTFRNVRAIEKNGLNSFYNLLASGNVNGAIYGRDVAVSTPKKASVDPAIVMLRNEKRKLERALDRLLNAYLFSDNSMSEAKYVERQNALESQLADANDKLGMAQADESQLALSDDEFLTRASEFIIAQKLTDREYVNYKRLAAAVKPEVLKTFVSSIIDHITVYNGKVQTIIFRNGLAVTFEYRRVVSRRKY